MEFSPVRPDLIKYEMRYAGGVAPWEREVRRPGAFGRFLSGIGHFLGAVSMPLSILFPPAAIAAAGMYGVGGIGDQVQHRAYSRAMESQAKRQNVNVTFPGLDLGGATGLKPASASMEGISARDQEIMNLLFSRDASLGAMSKAL